MEEQDIVRVGLWTDVIEGRRRPSSEHQLHALIYRARDDVHAIIHHHSAYATAVSVARKTIPSIIDEAVDLTPVPTVKYAPSGTVELAMNAAAEFAKGHNAALLANHGVVVCGETLNQALSRAVDVERLARIFVGAEAMGGAVPLEDWAVAKNRHFLTQYRMTKQRHEPPTVHPLPELPRYVRAADLVTFAIRSWITFSSMMHNLVMQRLRR
jgi:L-fuculose-phosphate aldolase